jgi:CTP synthase
MNDQIGKENTGGTMRLGTYQCFIEKNTLAEQTFAKQMKEKKQIGFIEERHRHRYEVNQKFAKEIEKGGVKFSGFSKDKKLVELVEVNNSDSKNPHPFFLATQSHPEFLSRPWAAHPMFLEFIKASAV